MSQQAGQPANGGSTDNQSASPLYPPEGGQSMPPFGPRGGAFRHPIARHPSDGGFSGAPGNENMLSPSMMPNEQGVSNDYSQPEANSRTANAQDRSTQSSTPAGGPAGSRKKARAYALQGYDMNPQAPSQPPGTPGYTNPADMFMPGAGTAGVGGAAPYGQQYGQQPADGYGQQYGSQNGAYQASGQPAYAAGYAAAPGYSPNQAHNVAQTTQQFGQMNVSPNAQSIPLLQIESIDLMNTRTDIGDLYRPPPPILLPENSALTPSPYSNCSPDYMRSTINAIPNTSSLLKKSKLPFAISIRPFTTLLADNVPVVGDTLIARCRRCRAYINPYATFIEGGHKWKCNLCNLVNEVPQGFDWDSQQNKQLDRWTRSEINHAVVDFVAPVEYMVRPPQPLVYVFLIDVSFAAVTSGLLATASRVILEALDQIPNSDKRTKIAFIAVDSSLHYFSLSPSSPEARMLVVGDLDEPYLPQPNDLLVSLAECRESIENLLSRFGDMFASTQNGGNAMGPALKAAHKLINNIGGKVVCLMSTLPNLGEGKLSPREDAKALGTSSESKLLQTQNPFYKSFAVECSKTQVTIDMFLFSPQYQDVASLSCLPRFTAGATHYYPGWNANNFEDVRKFGSEFTKHLSQEIALEAVLRVRGNTGLRMNSFHGNFFNRSTDLCAFPTYPRDQGYVVEVAIDETLEKKYITLQAAVLHSTCHGERRIRVLTLVLPVTQNLSEVYASADQLAITNYMAVKAVEAVQRNSLDSAREAVNNKLHDILDTYKKHLLNTNTGASVPLRICSNLKLLPLLTLALSKHLGLRKSSQIPTDLRSAALNYLSTFPVALLLPYIHPRFYSLHDMPPECGLPGEDGRIVLPQPMNLTAQNLTSHGLYLIDDGMIQFLYVGGMAVPQLCQDVFGVSDISQVRAGKTSLPEVDNEFNQKLHAILAKSRDYDDGKIFYPHLYVVRPDTDPNLLRWCCTNLIEDRGETMMLPSYTEFLGQLKNKLN